jgi:hypothetical protein
VVAVGLVALGVAGCGSAARTIVKGTGNAPASTVAAPASTVTTTYTVTSVNCKPGEVPPIVVHQDVTPGETAIGPNGQIMHLDVNAHTGPIDCAHGLSTHPPVPPISPPAGPLTIKP